MADHESSVDLEGLLLRTPHLVSPRVQIDLLEVTLLTILPRLPLENVGAIRALGSEVEDLFICMAILNDRLDIAEVFWASGWRGSPKFLRSCLLVAKIMVQTEKGPNPDRACLAGVDWLIQKGALNPEKIPRWYQQRK